MQLSAKSKGTNKLSEEKQNGRFYTPSYIVKNVCDLSGYTAGNIRRKHVIDNSCGDGAFLTEIVRRYCSDFLECESSSATLKSELETFIHGIELSEEEARKCRDNLSNIVSIYDIHDVDWDIVCGDTLTIDKYDAKMDFVLGNPPYVRVHNLGDSFEEIKSFSFAQNGMTDLYIVFYEIGLRMLNKTGILGYITPSSFYNSLAGSYMRKYLVAGNFIDKIVDLKHHQAFEATTYTTIVVLRNDKQSTEIEYFTYDSDTQRPVFCERLCPEDFYITDSFYFGSKEDVYLLKKIFSNNGKGNIEVKNGYATLCDDVFIGDFNFTSDLILPVIKASKGIVRKMLYPYDKFALLIPEETLKKDEAAYRYLSDNKETLKKRSNERKSDRYWYAFGRSQAIADTYKDKIAVNSLLRTEKDIKLTPAPPGTGVYSGLYIMSDSISVRKIAEAIKSPEFVSFISLLGKYKSGGYYAFSSKDLKAYLNYKFAYNGGRLSYVN